MILFLSQLTLLRIALIEQENNVDDDFTEYVRTFIKSYLPSTLDQYFLVVFTIIIIYLLYIRVSWGE